MLKALRASLMLLVLVSTAHAGEALIPPAPPQPQSAPQEPSRGETLYIESVTPDVSDKLTNAVLELLAILPALL